MTAAKFEMLANRVRKNARHLGKWAKREGVTCWRGYDRDIPELPPPDDTEEGALPLNEHRQPEELLRRQHVFIIHRPPRTLLSLLHFAT